LDQTIEFAPFLDDTHFGCTDGEETRDAHSDEGVMYCCKYQQKRLKEEVSSAALLRFFFALFFGYSFIFILTGGHTAAHAPKQAATRLLY
jgi:hypothetical protein